MPTSYDTIYNKFLDISKTDNKNLPTTDDGKYGMITTAIDAVNNRIRTDYTYDNELEQVNENLNNDIILLIANYMRLYFLENQKTYYVTMFKPFMKEIGLLHYNTDIKAYETDISLQNGKIDEIIKNMAIDYE
mgnify:FL=1|jgi:vacuolar-type H+-ATPase catalytic subunit A/Vma1